MPGQSFAFALEKFTSFGDLLKYLRRRAGLTQRELSIVVGYSHAQISRLELNQRTPDLATVAAHFIPALELQDEPQVAARCSSWQPCRGRRCRPPGCPLIKACNISPRQMPSCSLDVKPWLPGLCRIEGLALCGPCAAFPGHRRRIRQREIFYLAGWADPSAAPQVSFKRLGDPKPNANCAPNPGPCNQPDAGHCTHLGDGGADG